MVNKFKGILFLVAFLLATALLLNIKSKDKEKGFFLSKDINSYNLYTEDGNFLQIENILGQPSVFFFGFLNCPDICPNTLAEMSEIILQLGEKKKNINFFFVTVDPERDTIDDMKEYLDHVRNSGLYKSENIASCLEYRNNVYDAVEISIME